MGFEKFQGGLGSLNLFALKLELFVVCEFGVAQEEIRVREQYFLRVYDKLADLL